ncbi:BAR adaptor protein Hob1 [Coemansia aciculifera]|uniref:BAR adaptor protein Hob1 n=1 Tax=Coemansia aciculifera TaxID=417176 RepID=A0ACC1LSS3_9FUNG|nr:BAR adaptor protein Hob1 [Coemansia aciculifera]
MPPPVASSASGSPYGTYQSSFPQQPQMQQQPPMADTKSPYGTYESSFPSQQQPSTSYQPAYQQQQQHQAMSAAPPAYNAPPVEKAPIAPPLARAEQPPPPRNNVQYVVALYDYAALTDGDLSFKEGDRIELVQRADSKDDWWTGRLNGVEGVFPGTYVTDPR